MKKLFTTKYPPTIEITATNNCPVTSKKLYRKCYTHNAKTQLTSKKLYNKRTPTALFSCLFRTNYPDWSDDITNSG